MTVQPDRAPAAAAQATPAPGTTCPVSVPALLSSVPCPGTPPGTFLPGVLAAGAACTGGRIVRVTRLALAAPGKPDGEAGTRPLVPLRKQPHRDDNTGPAQPR
jgi:hypothetical protein